MKTKAKPEAGPGKPPAALPSGCESLLSRDQIATALGISTRTLDSMLSAGDYPPADTYLGSLPRWRVETHNGWIAKRCTKKKGA